MTEVPAHLAAAPTWSAALAGWRGTSRPAIVGPGGTWSGDQLLRRAAAAAEFLVATGTPPGVPVPVLLAPGPGALALVVGGAACGRPIAPLGPQLATDDLTACIVGLPTRAADDGRSAGRRTPRTRGGPGPPGGPGGGGGGASAAARRLALVGPSGAAVPLLADAAYEALARAVAERTGRRLVLLPEGAALPAAADPVDLASGPGVDPDSVAFVLHTSGSRRQPQPVSYRQGRLAVRTRTVARFNGLAPGAVSANASPLHHVAGMGNLSLALAAGATLVVVPRFSVSAWSALADFGVTHTLLLPTMIDTLLAAGALALPDLRVLQYGAAPMHPEMLARVLEALPDVDLVQLYGRTEGSPITVLTAEDHRLAAAGRPDLLGTVGRPPVEVELVIDTPDSTGAGEVWATAPYFMAPGEDGWLQTGDIGRLREDGYLELVGHKGDRIIRNGENVYPLEVEQVLAQHASVAEVAVVGTADPAGGEIVKAFVVAADPAAPPAAETLRRHAGAALAGFKVPTEWAVVEALPRTSTGKVLRRALLHPVAPDPADPSPAGDDGPPPAPLTVVPPGWESDDPATFPTDPDTGGDLSKP